MKRLALFFYDNFRVYGLPILAVVGLCMGINTVRAGSAERPAAEPVSKPAKSTFETAVAGAGIVESSEENIAVATNIAGVIDSIFVAVNQRVKAGDPLFEIDTREIRAQKALRESALQVAEAQLADVQAQYDFLMKIQDKRAISADDLTKKKNGVRIAEARVRESLNAVKQIETELDRSTVRSPIDGQVLKVNIRKGEFAPAQITQSPLLLLGKTDTLWVRADVDENDAWRVQEGAKARATLRGSSALGVDLKFVRFEPFIIPKRSLTGENIERVDTRVLQIIYEFEPASFPVYVGQLMDVYIEAKPHG